MSTSAHTTLVRIIDEIIEATNVELNVGHIRVLLYIADHNGTSSVDISTALGMYSGTVSRTLRNLGSYLVKDEHGNGVDRGYGLIRVEQDPYLRNRVIIGLTPKGVGFIKRLTHIIGGK